MTTEHEYTYYQCLRRSLSLSHNNINANGVLYFRVRMPLLSIVYSKTDQYVVGISMQLACLISVLSCGSFNNNNSKSVEI